MEPMETMETDRVPLHKKNGRNWRAAVIFSRLRMMAVLAASSVVLSADTCNGDPPVVVQEGDKVMRIRATEDPVTGWAGYVDSTTVLVQKQKPGTEGFGDDPRNFDNLSGVRMKWQSSNTNVVVIQNDDAAATQRPRLSFIAAGTAILTAQLDDPRLSLAQGATGSVTIAVKVSDPAAKLQISPRGGIVITGQTISMVANILTASGAAALPVKSLVNFSCVDISTCHLGIAVKAAGQILETPPEIILPGTPFKLTGLVPGVVRVIVMLQAPVGGSSKTIVADTVTVTVVDPVVPAKVTIDPAAASVFVGGTRQLTASVFDKANKLILTPVSWIPKDATLAAVSSTGLVTALSTGNNSNVSAIVQVIARAAEGVEATANLTIYKQVANVLVTPNPKELQAGSTQQFTADLKDNNNNTIPPQATSITWSVDNIALATVDQNGLVAAIAPGLTKLVATTAEGVRGAADLSVVAAPPASSVVKVVVTPSPITLRLSNIKCQFTAKAYDVNGNEVIVSGFNWVVDVSAVASVDQKGLVTFISAGTTAVRAFYGNKADSPGGFATLTVNP